MQKDLADGTSVARKGEERKGFCPQEWAGRCRYRFHQIDQPLIRHTKQYRFPARPGLLALLSYHGKGWQYLDEGLFSRRQYPPEAPVHKQSDRRVKKAANRHTDESKPGSQYDHRHQHHASTSEV